jgi:hypothetical protein
MEGNIILDIKIAIFISRIFKLQNVRSEFVTIIILADFVVNVADVILPVFLDFPEVARGESISASYCDDIIIAHRIYAIMNNKA